MELFSIKIRCTFQLVSTLQISIGMKFGGVNGRLHGNMKQKARK